MAQSGAAYDYDPDTLKEYYDSAARRVKQPPELKVVENRGHGASFARAAIVFIMVLIIICATLYNQVALTELTSQIETAQTQLESLKNEQRRMLVQLESSTSLRTVQEIAETQLGMNKAESYQIQYVDLGCGDRVLLARERQPGLSDRIRDGCRALMEYLGF